MHFQMFYQRSITYTAHFASLIPPYSPQEVVVSGSQVIVSIKENNITNGSNFFVSTLQTFNDSAILINSHKVQSLRHDRLQVVKISNLKIKIHNI